MTPTDNRGVHTHDFRLTGRCVCGELAVSPAAKVAPVAPVDDKWLEETEEWASAEYLAPDAIKFLQARLRRLLRERQGQTAVVHMSVEPDMEKRAEIWNEGFDTAHRQGIGGEASSGWLLNKLAPILDELRGELPDTEIDDLITRICDQVLDDSLIEDADSDTRPDQQRGMYGKYFVERLHDPEGRHTDCRFFVLDPLHDPYALTALKEYVLTSQQEFPQLAEDLREWISDIEGATE